MLFIIIGSSLYLLSILYRGIFCKPDCKISDIPFVGSLLVCLFSNIMASIGFYFLLEQETVDGANYSAILIIMSLLTAGVISGKFAFSHHDVATDERVLATGMSVILSVLFYLLFGSVSYYAGISDGIGDAPYLSIVIPLVMGLVLTWNTLHDFWDYRAIEEE